MIDAVMYSIDKIDFAVVAGSGMGKLFVDSIIEEWDYRELFNTQAGSAPSHRGKAALVRFEGVSFLLMSGRKHFYEGVDAKEVCAAIDFVKRVGVNKIILLNAAGGFSDRHFVGDLVLINDQVNFQFRNPLRGLGPNLNGVYFPDMSAVYRNDLTTALKQVALQHKIELKEGVYLGLTGPSLESKAEYKMISILGADLVGMSTVPEVHYANYVGLECAVVSVVSNVFDVLKDDACTEEEIFLAVENSLSNLEVLLKEFIRCVY